MTQAEEQMDTWMENWWALALRAAAAIIIGIIAFALPVVTIAAIVLLFGAYALIDGTLALIAAVKEMRNHGRWGVMLFEGIIGIAAGVIALLWPGIGALALTLLVAAWALTTGVLEIILAVRLRRVISGEWLLILGGVLSIVLAILVALYPGVGAIAIVWWIGAYALAYGVIMLTLALRIRHLVSEAVVASGSRTTSA
jgi:uncharacterized membrane protein HdeD (DUF308 family)